MKRIVNTFDGAVPRMDSTQAKKLLKTSQLGEDGLLPWHEAKEVLYQAYPDCVNVDIDGERRVNHRRLLDAVLADWVQAFKEGKAQGRPTARKDGLVERVDALVKSGEAKSIVHACRILERRKDFPELTDVRKAYYRRKK